MKSILLASTAAFAFAGAATAETTFGGTAKLGYNTVLGGAGDFYGDATLNVGFEQVLDNGLTFSGGFDVELVLDGVGLPMTVTGFNAMVASDTASLAFGAFDNGVAFDAYTGVDGMVAKISESDITMGLVGKAMFGGFEVAASLDMAAAPGDHPDQLEIAVTGDLGGASVGFGYEHDTGNIGLGASTTVGGADVAFAFAQTTETSIGLSGSMPVGPVTVGAYFASNSVSADAYGLTVDYAAGAITAGFGINNLSVWDVSFGYAEGAVAVDASFNSIDQVKVEGSYAMGNGLVMYAGFLSGPVAVNYVAAEMDLGGGAAVIGSWADAVAASATAQDYLEGITVELSFAW